jgi:hypothetical protein
MSISPQPAQRRLDRGAGWAVVYIIHSLSVLIGAYRVLQRRIEQVENLV